MKEKKKKIGEILLENKVITNEMLNEALEYQRRFGGGITEYLIARRYINEEELAKSLCAQFGLPYLLISVYEISEHVVKLVPPELAQKHLLMPIDRMGNILTVVMSDPFDNEAIEEVELITDCKVQPFVGILSDIVKAIEQYYRISLKDKHFEEQKVAPLFIDTGTYKGIERRKSVRLKAKIDIHFPLQELYKKSKIKNLSLHGVLFESDSILPIGAYVTLQIDLPQEISPSPISAVVQVVRVAPLPNKKFDIGASIVKMSNEDLKTLIKYSQMQQEEHS